MNSKIVEKTAVFATFKIPRWAIFEKQGMAEFRIEGTRIDVDATYPEKVDMNALLAQIKEALV